jgi:hypothetical protein
MNPLMFPMPRGCSKTWDNSVYIATDQKGIIRSRNKRDIINLFEYFVKSWCNVVEVPTASIPEVLKFFLPQLQSWKSVPSKLYEHIFMSLVSSGNVIAPYKLTFDHFFAILHWIDCFILWYAYIFKDCSIGFFRWKVRGESVWVGKWVCSCLFRHI